MLHISPIAFCHETHQRRGAAQGQLRSAEETPPTWAGLGGTLFVVGLLHLSTAARVLSHRQHLSQVLEGPGTPWTCSRGCILISCLRRLAGHGSRTCCETYWKLRGESVVANETATKVLSAFLQTGIRGWQLPLHILRMCSNVPGTLETALGKAAC